MVKTGKQESAKKKSVRKARASLPKNLPREVEYPSTDEDAAIAQPRESIVTPSGARSQGAAVAEERHDVQKALFRDGTSASQQVHPVTPARPIRHPQKQQQQQEADSPTKRKLLFGRIVDEVTVRENVRQVYSIVRKLTGSIGGNGSSGPIYGELTMGSMQKVINAMIEHTKFNKSSRFIDVGSGIGKPNLHVAQDPGVEFSYGIEVEHDRWLLGMTCLNGVLEAASKQNLDEQDTEIIQHRCMFDCGDISEAESFDPFTHVYMFSCGFPPGLWGHLSDMWNDSSSQYMICYSGPRHMITDWDFDLELLTRLPTSMHGSKEGHMAYIYRRAPKTTRPQAAVCDPLFQAAWDMVKGNNLDLIKNVVHDKLMEAMNTKTGPATRSKRKVSK
ncbi:hypothetical protein MPSEU_000383000 [Mayamaea pseudoterrestris]|nr:hypothetical protein MPSEU_000383000 [Mayamaea pseudoterrestris]